MLGFIQVSDDVWHYRDIGGGLECCVSCGKPIEFTKPDPRHANHHCSSKHEGRKAGANKRAEEPLDRSVPYGK